MKFIKEASPLRKALMGFGAITFVVGVVLLGVGAYSAFSDGDDGGNEVPLVDIAPASPTPTEDPGGFGVATPGGPTPVPTPPLGDSPYTMIIDKIGVNNPVETYGLDEAAVPEVPTGDNAADIVVWYDFSAKPGVGSNAVFAGHVTWFGTAVFYGLSSLVAGDEIKLQGQDGTMLSYNVTDVFQVDPSDPDSLQVMAGTPNDVLTIITCDGSYSDTGDPVFGGEYTNRLVVRADLKNITPGAAVAAGG